MTFLDEREKERTRGPCKAENGKIKSTQKQLPHGGLTHEMRYKRRMLNQNDLLFQFFIVFQTSPFIT